MLLNIEKIGEHLAVQIPPAFARQCGFGNGSKVNVRLKSDRIVIESVESSLRTIANPYAEADETERHSEIYFG